MEKQTYGIMDKEMSPANVTERFNLSRETNQTTQDSKLGAFTATWIAPLTSAVSS